MTIQTVLTQLIQQKSLSQKESYELVDILTTAATPAQIAGLLTAFASKGEAIEEIAGFIQGMREKAVGVRVPENTIDVCGTGGDGKHTFNISTASAFVLAGGGVPVAKHGNRAASSKCGSADVLEALGVHIVLTPQQAENVLEKVGLVFLFAPLFHGSFKHVSMVRKELGIKTIFNYIGPFANPGGVKRQVIGVPNKQIAFLLASVATKLSYKRVFIVTSDDGMDEASIFAKTHVFEVVGEKISGFAIDPQKYCHSDGPVAQKNLRSSVNTIGSKEHQDDKIKLLQGADAQTNAAIITDVLMGKKGPHRDIVLLNSALGFVVAGKVQTIKAGISLAEKSIDSGSALQVLNNLRKETRKYA